MSLCLQFPKPLWRGACGVLACLLATGCDAAAVELLRGEPARAACIAATETATPQLPQTAAAPIPASVPVTGSRTTVMRPVQSCRTAHG